MKVTIRIDDITPDMNWHNFNQFRDMLTRLKIKPLIGVVPDNKDSGLSIDAPKDDFWKTILALQAEGWMVAMHGVHHCYTTRMGGEFPLNHYSEFAGVPYEKQLQMLQEGKRILEAQGVETSIFMAPAHTFDGNTLKALKQCGFTMVTDGFGDKPYQRKGITFLPIAFQTDKAFKDETDGITTWVFHLNSLTEEQLKQIEAKMIQNRDKIINYDCFLSIEPYMQTGWQYFKERQLANTKRILVKLLKKVR